MRALAQQRERALSWVCSLLKGACLRALLEARPMPPVTAAAVLGSGEEQLSPKSTSLW